MSSLEVKAQFTIQYNSALAFQPNLDRTLLLSNTVYANHMWIMLNCGCLDYIGWSQVGHLLVMLKCPKVQLGSTYSFRISSNELQTLELLFWLKLSRLLGSLELTKEPRLSWALYLVYKTSRYVWTIHRHNRNIDSSCDIVASQIHSMILNSVVSQSPSKWIIYRIGFGCTHKLGKQSFYQ